MPLPLLLAIPALFGLAGIGVKKGFDAKSDFDEAKKLNKKAKKTYDDAKYTLKINKRITNEKLKELGSLKFNLYNNELSKFVELFSQIKYLELENNIVIDKNKNITSFDLLSIKKSVVKFHEIAGGGIASLGAGGLASFGALGGVGALASASTGTAIASLSGVAATNATLAWLGGGALAAGGYGMAGGVIMLGGIAIAPLLAVGGWVLSSKAEKAKDEAVMNLKKANSAVEEINIIIVVLSGINNRVHEIINILNKLLNILKSMLIGVETLIHKSNDYRSYNQNEKELIVATATFAKTIKNICDTPILDKDGKVTKESKKILLESQKVIEQIQRI